MHGIYPCSLGIMLDLHHMSHIASKYLFGYLILSLVLFTLGCIATGLLNNKLHLETIVGHYIVLGNICNIAIQY